ncbi:MAG: hypothetical protein ACD_9C00177G0004 [uncultured bacterium]|nr:MAG: hypothetical protein ACD_9C00177G0004 [uncultured bacterium]
MFFSSPSADLNVIFFLLAVALIISIATYFFSKKILIAVFIMSVLSNFVLFLNSGSRLFGMYEIKWVVVFTLDFWPYINLLLFILLVFNYFKNRNEQNKAE